MAVVVINKDFNRIKKKVALGMTKRQLICFLIAGVMGFLFYFLTRKTLGTTISLTIMIFLVMPVFFNCQYEKNGRYLEEIVKDIVRTKMRPGKRVYCSQNIYHWLSDEIYDKEVLGLGEEKQKQRGKKAAGAEKNTKRH